VQNIAANITSPTTAPCLTFIRLIPLRGDDPNPRAQPDCAACPLFLMDQSGNQRGFFRLRHHSNLVGDVAAWFEKCPERTRKAIG
jgi:hypothetical protein